MIPECLDLLNCMEGSKCSLLGQGVPKGEFDLRHDEVHLKHAG